MTDSAKAPSKGAWTPGAMRAAKVALVPYPWEPGVPEIEQVAEIISRETKDQEMAELLRRLVNARGVDGFFSEACIVAAVADSLLTELEGKL